eukprot:6191340-Pleurochrysis_carterae.AAC.6
MRFLGLRSGEKGSSECEVKERTPRPRRESPFPSVKDGVALPAPEPTHERAATTATMSPSLGSWPSQSTLKCTVLTSPTHSGLAKGSRSPRTRRPSASAKRVSDERWGQVEVRTRLWSASGVGVGGVGLGLGLGLRIGFKNRVELGLGLKLR